jgi:hypothetical protein
MVPSTTTITIRSRGSVERRDGGTAGGANHITARSKTVPLGAASMTIVCFPLSVHRGDTSRIYASLPQNVALHCTNWSWVHCLSFPLKELSSRRLSQGHTNGSIMLLGLFLKLNVSFLKTCMCEYSSLERTDYLWFHVEH